MANQRDAKKNQQDFFSNMQTAFLGDEGIVKQLEGAAKDLRTAAADMLQQNSQAQSSLNPNVPAGPKFNGDGTRRPTYGGDGSSLGGGYAGYGGLLRSMAVQGYGTTGSIFSHGNTFRAHYGDDGQVAYYDEVSPRGQVVGTHNRNSPVAQQGIARQQRSSTFAQATNAPSPFAMAGANGNVHSPGVSTVQHILNATVGKLPGPGAAIAGIVGGILGAPDAVMNGIVNERSKNAQYQAILGGTNWSTGVHNRWLQSGFKLSQLYSGGLTGAMSDEAFKGVTGLGYTGDLRNESLGMITSNYKNLGMGVNDSLQLVGIMAQSSNTAFNDLKSTLNEVSKAAKATGQNLELARANFTNLFGAATASLGGQGAMGTAGTLATWQASLGRDFQNVDMSNLLPGKNLGITALEASSMGMSPSQYLALQTGGGSYQGMSSQRVLAKATDKMVASALAPNVSVVQPLIQRMVQQAGGIKAVTANQQTLNQFMHKVMADPKFQASGVNFLALPQMLSALTGTNYNGNQAEQMLIRNAAGIGPSAEGSMDQSRESMLQSSRLEKVSDPYKKLREHGMSPNDDYTTKGGTLYRKTTNDPILDRFKDSGFYNKDTHVIVQTANGQKVVSGTYAYDHLKDQLARGNVQFIGGQHDGQSVADVVGGGYGESNYSGSSTTHVKGTDAKHFHSIGAFNKQFPSGGGGKVIIAPNPALAQLLNITATGNVAVANEGAMWGYAPKPGQVGTHLGN